MCVTESIRITREIYDQGYINNDLDDKWFTSSSFVDAITRYDRIVEYKGRIISKLSHGGE